MNRKTARDVLLRAFKVERSYKPKALVANPGWCFDDLLKLVVGYHLLEHKDFCFVQVGAFDGVSNDPVYEMASRHNLRGILVEPQSSAFEQLKRNYQDCPNVILVNAAVADVDQVREFYTTAASVSQQASFDRSHLLRHKIPAGKIVVQMVQCYTLQTLLNEHGFDHVDLIQIDAEGYDYEIIKTIDFTSMKPSIIRFEHAHLSDCQGDECVQLLASHGYRFLVERRDIIAYAEDSRA